MAASTLQTLHPWLKVNDTQTSSGTSVRSYSNDNGSDAIFCIVHGYPQSSYIWRHVLSDWKPHASLFVPELPGYGISSRPPTANNRQIGFSIIEALQKVIPNAADRPIYWVAHDRGARFGHRLLTAPNPPPNIKAAVFIDIVPTIEQWRAFANPAASTAYFHWPFLATATAPQVIKGVGGEAFCRMILARGRGTNEIGAQKLEANGAYDQYASILAGDDAIEGTCADYAEGAVPECQEQEKEQAAGTKVRVPLLVIYAEGSLAKMNDVEAIWPKWVEGGKVDFVGVGDGHGHFLPESAHELVAAKVVEFVKKHA